MLQYFMPTRVIMGEDSIKKNPSVFSEMGKKALIVTGKSSAKKNGSLDDVIEVLSKNGQSWSIYDKVMSNPTVECVYEGASHARAEEVDYVIGIGGGSPMDAAKAIAMLACQDITEDQLFSGNYGKEVLPMIFVPTTAGTGSEVTSASVLTHHKQKTKIGISSPVLFPDVAFLDAKYMDDLPRDVTVYTVIDALSHSVEGMLSVRANPLTDALASVSIRMIASCFEALKKFDLSRKDRENLLYASTLAGMVISSTGTVAVHAMGYSLTYFKNMDHGRANGVLLAEFLRFIEEHLPDKVEQILSYMGMKNVDEFKDLLDELLGLKEEITLDEINMYTEITMPKHNIKNTIVEPKKEDIFNIYKSSLC